MTQEEERRGARSQADDNCSQKAAVNGGGLANEFVEAQSEIWERLWDANRVWLQRMQSETALTIEFASKLTASKSFAETAEVFRDWTAKHMELATEDTRRLVADAQHAMDSSMRFWSKTGDRLGVDSGRRQMS
jgi:hypothetical protein